MIVAPWSATSQSASGKNTSPERCRPPGKPLLKQRGWRINIVIVLVLEKSFSFSFSFSKMQMLIFLRLQEGSR